MAAEGLGCPDRVHPKSIEKEPFEAQIAAVQPQIQHWTDWTLACFIFTKKSLMMDAQFIHSSAN